MTGTASDGGVVLAIIDGGTWASLFGRSLAGLLLHDAHSGRRLLRPGCGVAHVHASTGGIAAARNEMAWRFATGSDAEWLLMLDTDMGFADDILDRLIDSATTSKIPVVGALCFSLVNLDMSDLGAPRFAITPTVFDWVKHPESGKAGFMSRVGYAKGGLVECDATGAAALLVHRSVITDIYEKLSEHEVGPFDQITVPGIDGKGRARTFSEDMSFCIRVGGAGHKVAVDSGIKTTHAKEGVFLDEETAAPYRVDGDVK